MSECEHRKIVRSTTTSGGNILDDHYECHKCSAILIVQSQPELDSMVAKAVLAELKTVELYIDGRIAAVQDTVERVSKSGGRDGN